VLAGVVVVAAVGTIVSAAAVMSDGDDEATLVGGFGLGSMMGMSGAPITMMGGFGGEGAVESADEVKAAAEAALASAGYRGFRAAEVMRFENGAYVAVEESPGVGAFELIVDPETGAVFPEPGPNMMWNTRYGMMAATGLGVGGGMMSGPMMGGSDLAPWEPEQQLTAEQARAIAADWLGEARPGEEAGEPRAFPGYFTLDTEADGGPTGMLSVNAASGAVWFHGWHRGFLEERDW
jgi:hypothetical protein